MTYLFDTNAVSDMVAQAPKVRSRVVAMSAGDRAVTCTVVVGEVRFGVERLPSGARQADLAKRTAAVLAKLTCLPIDPTVADHYAQIKNAMRRLGRGIGENDLWIAATAMSLGAVLVSHDADVQGVPGLTVEDWSV